MTSDAVGHEGQLGPWPVPVPLDPSVLEGPAWLRGPRPQEIAARAVEAEHAADVVPAGVSPQDAAETAMRAIEQIDATISGLQAMRTQLMAGVGHVAIEDATAEGLDAGVGLRDAACELALRQRRSDRTVEAELGQAMSDVARWPGLMRAWGETRIHRGHVRVIAETGAPIADPETRAAFEAALIPHAEQTAPGRLKAIARRELERVLGEPLAERHRRARRDRSVHVTDVEDGMSMVQALVPTVLAHGIHDRLTLLAKAAHADDPRTFDQRRADALCDLLLAGEPTDDALRGIRTEISIVIPAAVLVSAAEGADGDGDGVKTGTAGEVARLATDAPVDPETALLLAARTKVWNRLFTDPVQGQVVAVDTYTPSKRLKRLLRARDQRCRFPGCGAPARRCDIDHTKPWAEGGQTCHDNLAHLCRRHHTLKGATLSRARRWKVRQRSPGVLEWTTPTGETYIDQPPQTGPVFRDPADEYWGHLDGTPVSREGQPF